MINANTEVGRSMYDNMKLHGSVMINVPEQLKPISRQVLTRELYEIMRTLYKFDPEIVCDAQEMLIDTIKEN